MGFVVDQLLAEPDAVKKQCEMSTDEFYSHISAYLNRLKQTKFLLTDEMPIKQKIMRIRQIFRHLDQH